MLRFDRKQQNSVKQLSFNKNNLLIKKKKQQKRSSAWKRKKEKKVGVANSLNFYGYVLCHVPPAPDSYVLDQERDLTHRQ